MTSIPGDAAAFEDAVVDACERHERAHLREDGYRRCVVVGEFFVKFDSYGSLYSPTQTQIYVSQCAEGDMSAPRVPKVIHFFHRDYQMAYVIMDYINLTPPPVPDLPQKAALAIQWLRDLPAPPGQVLIGPLGGGRARHVLFKDYEAPLSFSSVEAIERYLNKAITRLPRKLLAAPVSLRHERLVFTQSDMDESNFGVDAEGRTCLLDFGDVGLLPESFAIYTMSSPATFTAAVAQHLGWPSSSNLKTMSKIRTSLWMSSGGTLGLDENGYPKTA